MPITAGLPVLLQIIAVKMRCEQILYLVNDFTIWFIQKFSKPLVIVLQQPVASTEVHVLHQFLTK